VQDLLGLHNESSDNLYKHGGRFTFPELLVKFSRVFDDILVTLASDTKIGKLKVGGEIICKYRAWKKKLRTIQNEMEKK
jgi:hypothetical protein